MATGLRAAICDPSFTAWSISSCLQREGVKKAMSYFRRHWGPQSWAFLSGPAMSVDLTDGFPGETRFDYLGRHIFPHLNASSTEILVATIQLFLRRSVLPHLSWRTALRNPVFKASSAGNLPEEGEQGRREIKKGKDRVSVRRTVSSFFQLVQHIRRS